MNDQDREFCVLKELDIFMQELVNAHLHHEKEGSEQKSTFNLAQLYLLQEIFKVFQQNKDVDDLKECLEDYVDSETGRYEEARFEGNRKQARVMLARLRCTRRLLLRLNNHFRQELILKTTLNEPNPTPPDISNVKIRAELEEARLLLFSYAQTEEFQEGEDVRKIDPEHKRMTYEARKLQKEIKGRMRALGLTEGAGDAYLKCQERAADTLFNYFPEPKDWSRLRDFLLERIESSYLYYQQVREAEDHAAAVSIIGYLRFFTTLQRRISAPIQRRELRRKIEAALVIH